MQRTLISTGSPWEGRVGYSRAVRAGNHVFVSGTVAVDAEGKLVGPDDPYAQTKRALERIGDGLRQAGADFRHVVRTRIFTTDIRRWEEIGRAHGEVFGEIRPANTMVEVKALIAPEYLVEIEAEAFIHDA